MRLGTCIKIDVTLDTAPSACTITITDSADTVKVSAAAMSMVTTLKYRYIFQSLATDIAGRYSVTIEATSGVYEAVAQAFFTLLNLE